MKRKTLLLLIAAALSASVASCAKEKECRCAVANTPDIRIVYIKHGSCKKLYHVRYDRNETTQNIIDAVYCTDFDFTQNDE